MRQAFLEGSDGEDLKDFMQTWLEFQGLLEDAHQEVGADRRPDLDAHGVVAGADERADAQVLFDRAKEQLDLPTRPVKLGGV